MTLRHIQNGTKIRLGKFPWIMHQISVLFCQLLFVAAEVNHNKMLQVLLHSRLLTQNDFLDRLVHVV